METRKYNPLRILLAATLLFVLAACDDATRSNPGGGKPPPTGTLNLSRGIALGLGEESSVAASISTAQLHDPVVLVVNSDGTVDPLRERGEIFSDFRIINGRIFLIPRNHSQFSCGLLEALGNDTTVCVDPYLHEFGDIQVGPDGSVYYQGSTWNDRDDWVALIRRRTPAGANEHVFDLSGPLGVRSWAVASDGRFYLAGTTELPSTTEHWIRRLNADGSLTTISTGIRSMLLGVWPDGGLYVSDENHYGTIWRIGPEQGVLDPTPYMSFSWHHTEAPHLADELGIDSWNLDLWPPRLHRDRVLLEYPGESGLEVAELYPNPQPFEAGMLQVRSGVLHGDTYYFAGRLTGDEFAIVSLDINTSTTEVLYRTALEMFSLTLTPDASTAMFTALDASRNSYVMAAVELATNSITTEPITNTLAKLETIF